MVRLLILGLLQNRPMHGYEIQQFIQESQMGKWAEVLSGSIYFALNKMEEEGLIEAGAEERTGARVRKIYTITERGRAVLLDHIREALAGPPHSLRSSFSLALGFIHLLPPGEAEAAIGQSIRRLEEDRRLLEDDLALKKDPLIHAVLENDLRLIEQDLDFLRRLLGLIPAKAAPVEGGETRMKPTHLLVRTTGSWRGNPYTYEETVPIGKYEGSRWWNVFQPRRVKEVFKKIPGARVGDVFTIEDPLSRTRTEFRAIYLPDSNT